MDMMIDEVNAVIKEANQLNISASEWVVVLSHYTTEARLRVALPLLAERNPGRKFKHRELASFVGASREKTTKALGKLRASGEYSGELTRSPKV